MYNNILWQSWAEALVPAFCDAVGWMWEPKPSGPKGWAQPDLAIYLYCPFVCRHKVHNVLCEAKGYKDLDEFWLKNDPACIWMKSYEDIGWDAIGIFAPYANDGYIQWRRWHSGEGGSRLNEWFSDVHAYWEEAEDRVKAENRNK
jgi:hypothetical protein